MKKKRKFLLFGLALSVIIPTLAVSADTQIQHYIGYTIGTTQTYEETHMEFSVGSSDPYIYQNSNFTVSSMLADSGGGSCSFCKLVITGKKKGLLGIYTNMKSAKTVSTPTTGYYSGDNYGNVGTGTFRHYIKNSTHYSNSGTYRVNAQDFS